MSISDAGLSLEAQEFLRSYVTDDSATDFSKIEQIRARIHAEQTPAAERAVKRHQLISESITLGGVQCDRVVSRLGSNSGTLLYLFGGGFVVGSPFCDLPIIGALAEYCQVEVIAPKYSLAPEFLAPAAGDDCLSVWRALTEQYEGPLLLAGESAGGNLAVSLVQRAVSEGLRTPDAVALMSPAVDLRTDTELFAPTTYSDPTIQPNRFAEASFAYAGETPLSDPLISPLFGSMQGFPPTIITTGSRDLLLAMCLRFYRQLKRANVEVECQVWDGLWHVFEYYDHIPEAEESLREICVFLSSKVGGNAVTFKP